jgi:hypothetical protein
VPYRMVRGDFDKFNSASAQYFETTVQTLPDTYAFDYDASDGKIRYHMVGKSQLCKDDFERAQTASGGPPKFPTYEDSGFGDDDGSREAEGNGEGEGADEGNGSGNDNNGNDNDNNNNNGNSGTSARHTNSFLLLTTAFGLLYSLRR